MSENNFYVYALKKPDKLLDNEPQPFYTSKGNKINIKINTNDNNITTDTMNNLETLTKGKTI